MLDVFEYQIFNVSEVISNEELSKERELHAKVD